MTVASAKERGAPLGSLFVISGPSGAGKGTLVAAALQALPQLHLSISATTRPPRLGDREGVTYYFKSEAEFDKLIEENGLLEWAEIHGNRYGTPDLEIKKALFEGKSILLEIDPQGFEQVRARFPEAYSVFVAPPSLAVLEGRLRLRATESPEAIERRMHTAQAEMQTKNRYNAVIINDDLEAARKEFISLLAEHLADAV